MKLILKSDHDLPPASIARALVNATPEEFAAVWVEIYLLVDKNHPGGSEKLEAIAKAMAPRSGSGGRTVFLKIAGLINYHVEQNRRDEEAKE